MEITRLTDEELTVELKAAVVKERKDLVRLLQVLAEFDDRKLGPRSGRPSLFEYCRQDLRYSEGAANRRIAAARAGREYPSIWPLLRSGELSLVGVAMLQRHLNSENHQRLIQRARNKSQEEIAKIIAELAPAERRRDVIRPAIVAPPPPPTEPSDSKLPLPEDAPSPEPSVYRVSFDATPETIALIKRAREVLRHRVPFGDLDPIIRQALERLLDEADRDRKQPSGRPPRPSKNARRIPEAVKAAVWTRDEGRCAYVGADGARCATRSWLEFDHVRPFALGGASDSAGNVRLLCREHNQLAAVELLRSG